MTNEQAAIARLPIPSAGEFSTCRTGRIVAVGDDGRVFVDFPGNPGEPVAARCLTRLGTPEVPAAHPGIDAEVLLLFENGDPGLPILVGLVTDRIPTEPETAEASRTDPEQEVLLDGRRMVFTAREEIRLRCGESTLLLRNDGKILIRGAELVSRASGRNKIKGASITLN
ncbi:MAG: DUF6484 domain-containing protein [Candidatus Eisenbacteria bacterium]